MIHHLSVAARDPKAVADFLVEIMDGGAIDFTPNPGAFMVFAKDGHGTGVEIYPAGSVMRPDGEAGAGFAHLPATNGGSPTHFALSVDRSIDEVRTAAAERGWACFECDRGGHFHVMEVWVENAWLIEVLPPQFAAEYLRFAAMVTGASDAGGLMESHPAKLAA
jgi:catechol 2,3-dioxygenase-like lactoylglutathione lyase family enzyme